MKGFERRGGADVFIWGAIASPSARARVFCCFDIEAISDEGARLLRLKIVPTANASSGLFGMFQVGSFPNSVVVDSSTYGFWDSSLMPLT